MWITSNFQVLLDVFLCSFLPRWGDKMKKSHDRHQPRQDLWPISRCAPWFLWPQVGGSATWRERMSRPGFGGCWWLVVRYMSPENQWLQDYFPIEVIPFLGDMLVFGGCNAIFMMYFCILPLLCLPSIPRTILGGSWFTIINCVGHEPTAATLVSWFVNTILFFALAKPLFFVKPK